LRFLMEWPSLVDAARLIERRADEIQAEPEAGGAMGGETEAALSGGGATSAAPGRGRGFPRTGIQGL